MKMSSNDVYIIISRTLHHIFRTYACDFLKVSAEEIEVLEILTTNKVRTAGLQSIKMNLVTKPEMAQLHQMIKHLSEKQDNKRRQKLKHLCNNSKFSSTK